MSAATNATIEPPPNDVPGAGVWVEANQRYLYAAIEVIRARIARSLCAEADLAGRERSLARAEEAEDRARQQLPAPSSLQTLSELFGLGGFEREVLLIAAGMRLSPGFAAQLAAAQKLPAAAPSFELAFAVSNDPHWSAITPSAALRRYHLIDVERPDDLLQSPLRLDERILYFLLGVPALDARLDGLLEPVDAPDVLTPSYAELARQLAACWSASERAAVQLCGPDPDGKQAIVAAACSALGIGLYTLRAMDTLGDAAHRTSFVRLLDRELSLSGAALLLVVGDDDPEEARVARTIGPRLRAPIVLACREPITGLACRDVRLALQPLGASEQRALWRAGLGAPLGHELQRDIDRIVGHFALGPAAIRAAAATLEAAEPGERSRGHALWDVCRSRGRFRLSQLAERIESRATWADLVLPNAQKQLLEEIVSQLEHRSTVHDDWGFAGRGMRGLGLTALFHGESGTGKTLAAECIANQLRLDLWRIDLSRVLDKYIGETEKNLRRVFDAAEDSGGILLFDEADALFAKRTEGKDSAERFTNVEVGYLLQRIESYFGLAILTTNLKSAIDTAFLRRIRFVVQFPFPRAEQRALIWSRSFPARAPKLDLDMARLAQLNMAGGNIRNIALNAAFLAAQEGSPIGVAQVLRAARSECAKLERALADAEIAGWT